MKIKILGHASAAKFLEQNPNQFDVIFISDPRNSYAIEGSEQIPKLAKEICSLFFYDLISEGKDMFPGPSQKDIEKALEFAKGRENLLVSCQAGISRSSATAYVIKAAETNPIDALDILDKSMHLPNDFIIYHGSNILNLNLTDVINRWKKNAEQFQIHDEIELDIQK